MTTTDKITIQRFDVRGPTLRPNANAAWDFEATYRLTVPGQARKPVVRVRLHWDSSYTFQSFAVADLFDDMNQRWNELTRVAGENLAELAWSDGTGKLASGYAPRFDSERATIEADCIAQELLQYAMQVVS